VDGRPALQECSPLGVAQGNRGRTTSEGGRKRMWRRKRLRRHVGIAEGSTAQLGLTRISWSKHVSEAKETELGASLAGSRAGALLEVGARQAGCSAVGDPRAFPGGDAEMLRVRCPQCGGYHDVADTAQGCPSCRTPTGKSSTARLVLLVALGIGLGIIGGLVIGGLICRAVSSVWKDCGWWMIALEPLGPAAS